MASWISWGTPQGSGVSGSGATAVLAAFREKGTLFERV